MSTSSAYGGCGCSGGAESAPTIALANKSAIRKIAERIGHLVNKKIDTSGTAMEVVQRLRAVLPDPSRNRNIKASGPATDKLVRGVAAIINDVFEANVVDTSASTSEMCDQIAEELTGLSAGVQAQFAGVRVYTERILKNLQLLEQIHSVVFARITQKIAEADKEEDGSGMAKTSVLRDFHNAIHAEITRQRHLLESMLGIVVRGSQSDQELAQALKHSRDLKGFVRGIKNTAAGTAKFNEKLGYMMAGTASAAHSMAVLESAMQKLGITRAELAKADSVADARNMLSKKLEAKLDVSNPELKKLIKAEDLIMEKLYMLRDLGAKTNLIAVGAGVSGGGDGDDIPEELMEYSGGEQKLDKRIKERQGIRTMLLKQFNIRMAALWEAVVRGAGDFGKAISAGRVPLSDKLDRFNTALSLIQVLHPNVYFALSGYYNDAAARQVRESFIGNLEFVLSTVEALQGESGYSSQEGLKSMKTAIAEIKKLIADFSERYATGFEMIAPPKGKLVDRAADAIKGADEIELGGVDNVEGADGADSYDGALDRAGVTNAAVDVAAAAGTAAASVTRDLACKVICGGADPVVPLPQLNKVADDLERTKDIISYAVRQRQIRNNLSTMHSELPHYGEDHTKITADAIANSVDQISRALRTWKDNNAPGKADGLHARLLAAMPPVGAAAATELDGAPAKLYDAAVAMHTHSADARARMLRTAEAVNMYMQKFAQAIAASPDNIRDIITDISESHINIAWFHNKSGDAICNVFDACPSAWNAAGAPLMSNLAKEDANVHYYVRVGRGAAAGTAALGNPLDGAANPPVAKAAASPNIVLPGNPYIGQSAVNYAEHVKLAESALKVTALKNIIATFLNVADKLGARQVSSEIPMTPAEIYANLNLYISGSAFACKYTGAANIATANYDAAGTAVAAYPGGNTVVVDSTAVGYAPRTVGGLPPPPGAGAVAQLAADSVHDNATYAMRGVGAGAYDGGCFTDTDCLFRMVIKSIIAKIFVARGLSDVLTRPLQTPGLGYYNELRLIIGGDIGSNNPKIIDSAFELYIRLPLYAELYREIFVFPDNDDAKKSITLVPEMDGIFSNLISLMFDRAAHVTDGNYSDSDLAIMIAEINRIYERYSKESSPIDATINAFIAEINARYGVVARSDAESFLKERNARWTAAHTRSAAEETSDYSLPELDEEEKFNRPMPSQMLEMGAGPMSGTAAEHKHKLDLEVNSKMIRRLRGKLSLMFSETDQKLAENIQPVDAIELQDDINKRITLKHLIRSRQEELKYAKSDEEKYAIVLAAMNSLGKYALSPLERAYIAFHEVVLTPLHVLHASFLEAKGYRNRIRNLGRAVEALKNERIVGGGFAAAIALLGAVERGAPAADVYTAAAAVAAAAGAPANFATVVAAEQLKIGQQLKALAKYVRADEKRGAKSLGGAAAKGAMPALSAEYSRCGGAAAGWAALDADIRNLADDKQRGAAVARWLPKQERMMRHMVEAIYSHTGGDKMAKTRIEIVTREDKTCAVDINVDHRDLINHVQQTIQQIKTAYGKFRGLLPVERIQDYENDKCVGSIFWLEREYIEDLIAGHVGDNPELQAAETLDRSNARLHAVVEYLKEGWAVRISAAAGAVEATAEQVPSAFLDVFTEMVCGSPAQTRYGGAPPLPLGNGVTSINASTVNRSSKAVNGTAPNTPWGDVAGITVAFDEDFGLIEGAVMQLNRLLQQIMKLAYDSPTMKFFTPLVNEFATGAFSRSVMSSGTQYRLDDATADAPAVLQQAEVILASLAASLQHFITDKSADGKTPLYADIDVSALQLYTKESMRSELPLFECMLGNLIDRCALLAKMCRAFSLAPLDPAGAPAARTKAAEATASAEKQQRAIALLDRVTVAAQALQNGCKEALKLVGDDPKYFEMSQSFIADYRSLNGVEPFMPLSSATAALRADYPELAAGVVSGLPNLLLPNAAFASDEQKFHYGTRRVLHSAVRAADMPGYMELLKQHNQSCDKRFMVDDDIAVTLANSTLAILRQVVDAQTCRYWFSTKRYSATGYGAPAAPAAANIQINTRHSKYTPELCYVENNYDAFGKIRPYAGKSSLRRIIDLTTSAAQRDSRRVVSDIVERNSNCKLLGDRKDMIVFNIIDSNKVPINVHALMRDIPAANLHNYSATYDHIINSILDTRVEDIGTGAVAFAGVPNGKTMLAQMLINPHAQYDDDTYEFRFSQIVRGDLGISGLAQPKMIGQELYSKALFGEIYPGQVFKDEPSPALANANMRGRTSALYDGVMSKPDGRLYSSLLTLIAQQYPATAAFGVLAAADYSAMLKLSGDALLWAISRDVCTRAGAAGGPLAPPAGGALSAAEINFNIARALQTILPYVAADAPGANYGVAYAQAPAVAAGIPVRANNVQAVLDCIQQLYALTTYVAAWRKAIVAATAGAPGANPGKRVAFEALKYIRDSMLGNYAPAPRWAPRQLHHIPPAAPAAPAVGLAAVDDAGIENLVQLGGVTSQPSWEAADAADRRDVARSNPGYFPPELHYMKLDNKHGRMAGNAPERVDVGGHKDILQVLGKLRFDTMLVRNLTWMVGIQRIVLLKLQTDYTWHNEKTPSGPAILARGVAETYGNDMNRNAGRSHRPGNYRY